MASAPYPHSLTIGRVNLDNYFPTKCSYNSTIYVHKKFIPQYQKELQKNANNESKDTKAMLDKCQQFDTKILSTEAYKVKESVGKNTVNDPVVEETIHFARGIIPLTIPPSTDVSPRPFYTVKAVKKSKRRSTNLKSESVIDTTYDKVQRKNIYENITSDKLKRQRESISEKETGRSSQSNTLDDINENRTLSCTLSEISEKKHHKENRHCKRNKRNEMQKVAVSESFEAVATEFMNTSSDTKIKIHLMNEKDKNLFCQNIQMPVIESLKECIMELNNNNLKALQCMQTSIEEQTRKMDLILDKLTCFEDKLTIYTKPSTKNIAPSTKTKASKLEELSADIFQVKVVSSSDEEELGQIDLVNDDQTVTNTMIKGIKSNDKNFVERENKIIENFGRGEEVPAQLKAPMGIKLDRPNRAPARFCWTDAGRSN